MYRLTNENGLIKGNFNYDAVKEAVERLYRLECLFDEHHVKDWIDLDERLEFGKKTEMPKKASKEHFKPFKPYLSFEPVEIEIISDFFDTFYPNATKNVKTKKKIGFIGEETHLLDKKGKTLNVGDIVVVRFKEDNETIIEKTTIIVKDYEDSDNKAFPMGFKNTSYESLTRIRKCTELNDGEKYANCVKVVLKEEKENGNRK